MGPAASFEFIPPPLMPPSEQSFLNGFLEVCNYIGRICPRSWSFYSLEDSPLSASIPHVRGSAPDPEDNQQTWRFAQA